jgi:hypothetical protein
MRSRLKAALAVLACCEALVAHRTLPGLFRSVWIGAGQGTGQATGHAPFQAICEEHGGRCSRSRARVPGQGRGFRQGASGVVRHRRDAAVGPLRAGRGPTRHVGACEHPRALPRDREGEVVAQGRRGRARPELLRGHLPGLSEPHARQQHGTVLLARAGRRAGRQARGCALARDFGGRPRGCLDG